MKSMGDVQEIGNEKIKLIRIEGLGKIYFREISSDRKLSSEQKCSCHDIHCCTAEYVLISEKSLIAEGYNLFLPCALDQDCYNKSVEIIKRGFAQWQKHRKTNSFPRRKIKKWR